MARPVSQRYLFLSVDVKGECLDKVTDMFQERHAVQLVKKDYLGGKAIGSSMNCSWTVGGDATTCWCGVLGNGDLSSHICFILERTGSSIGSQSCSDQTSYEPRLYF